MKKKKQNALHANIYTQSDEATIKFSVQGCISSQKHVEHLRQVNSRPRLKKKKECL